MYNEALSDSSDEEKEGALFEISHADFGVAESENDYTQSIYQSSVAASEGLFDEFDDPL